MKTIKIKWRGRGFGEQLILAWLTQILVDNGVDAVFNEKQRVKGLINCPIFDSEIHKNISNHRGDYTTIDIPLHLQHILKCEKYLNRKLKITRNYIPVTFHEIPEIPAVDVVMCTRAGGWTPYRNWPYFNELKKLFDNHRISYVDLNANRIYNHECLNYVKRCKLYIGLDTGTSHYVSKFANGKALILHSGFSPLKWAFTPYEYSFLSGGVYNCAPCWINKRHIKAGNECKFNHKCMKEIKPERVFDVALEYL